MWKTRAKGQLPSARLSQRLQELAQHHTQPIYREMAWQGQPWSYATPKRRKPKTQDPWYGYKGHPKPKDDQPALQGFDGKRISLSSSSWETSQSQGHGAQQDEVAKLRAVVSTLAQGGALTTEQKQMLEVSPDEMVRQEQKELNQKRKKLAKLRNLEQKIKDNESKFTSWYNTQKTLVKQERERYTQMQEQLQKDLDQLKNEQDTSMEHDEDDEEDLFELDNKETSGFLTEQMNRRVEAAEMQAHHAQQAMLAMQAQVQQLTAYTMQLQLATPTPEMEEHCIILVQVPALWRPNQSAMPS